MVVDDQEIFPKADEVRKWGWIGDTDPALVANSTAGKPYWFFCVATVTCFTKKVM